MKLETNNPIKYSATLPRNNNYGRYILGDTWDKMEGSNAQNGGGLVNNSPSRVNIGQHMVNISTNKNLNMTK